MSAIRDWVYAIVTRSGEEEALSELIKKCEQDRQRDNELFHSRFFELRKERNEADGELTGRKFLVKVTEKFISSSVDMADCRDGDEEEFLYMEDDGSLHPVTIGSMTRWAIEEHEMVYGASDLIANGKVVGRVDYTDH